MKNQKLLDLLDNRIQERNYLYERDRPFVIALFKFLKDNNISYDLDGIESLFNESICNDLKLIKEVIDNCEKYQAEKAFSKEVLEELTK